MSIDHYEQFTSCRYVHHSPRLVLVWFVVVAVLPSSSCPFFSLTDLPRWFHHNSFVTCCCCCCCCCGCSLWLLVAVDYRCLPWLIAVKQAWRGVNVCI